MAPSKDAYYFSHDSNARDDPKCVLLIEQLGLEGYGIFWVLVETLRDQPGYRYPLSLLPALARRYNTTYEKMKTVVHGYGLFAVTDDEFFHTDFVKFSGRSPRAQRARMYAINVKKWMEIRKHVFRRDNFTCAYCGKVGGILEADHIVPFSKGGSDDIENLTTSCRKCNRRKRDKSAEEFIAATFGGKPNE